MFKRNILSSFVNQSVKILLKLVISILVARTLGKEKYGQVTYFLLVFNLISNYGHFGINNGAAYFSKFDSLPRQEQFNINQTYLLINTAVFGVLLGVPFVRERVLNGYSTVFLVLGILYVLFQYSITLMISYYISEERLYLANKYVLFGSVFATICLVAIWCCNIVTAKAYICILVLEFLLVLVLLYKNLGYSFHFKLNRRFLLREWRYGNVLFWSALFIYLNYRVDQFMIRQQYGDAELGVYAIAVSIADIVLFIPDSFTNAILGRLMNISQEKREQTQVVCMSAKCCLYICIMISCLGTLMGPLIPLIYGSQYAEAIPCFSILLVGICGVAMAKIVFQMYAARGKVFTNFWITLTVCLTNLIMNRFLIPAWGIKGAAIASTISYMVYGLSYVFLLRMKEGIPFHNIFIFNRQELSTIARSIPFFGRQENDGDSC